MPRSRLNNRLIAFLSLITIAILAVALISGCTTARTTAETQTPPIAVSTGTPAPEADSSEPPADSASDPDPDPSPARALSLKVATITRVVDGDTAHVRIAKTGETEKVRFIGVNTPESTTQHEPFGKEASAYTKKRLPVGRKVYLETDSGLRDRYGRLLAYVWLSKPTDVDKDGRATFAEARDHMFNAHLMRDGYAQVMTIPPNVRYQDYFLKLERQARRADRGLWGLTLSSGSSKSSDSSGDSGGSGGSDSGVSGAYIGNRNTMKFHYPSCASVDQMNPANKVPLKSRSAAISGGYVPCKNCNP